MRLFFELAKRSFQRHMTYRAAMFGGLATNFFFGLMRMAVLVALMGEREVVDGYDVAGVLTYSALTQAMIGYINLFGWFGFMQSIHSGEIAADLLKPVNIFKFWLARDLGRAIVNLLLRGLVIMGLFALIVDLALPQDLITWLWLLVSLFFAWLLAFSYAFLVNLAGFWSPNAVGIGRFCFVVSWLFSGFLMPLNFYPDWVQRIALWTPFPYMIDTVVEVYLGILTGPELFYSLALQLFWSACLILFLQWTLRRAIKRLVILGG